MMNISEKEFRQKFNGECDQDSVDDLSEEAVQQWLDSHEEFVFSYFSRKAIKSLQWRARKRSTTCIPRIVCDTTGNDDSSEKNVDAQWMQSLSTRSTPTHEKSSSDMLRQSVSANNTPVRKVSHYDKPLLLDSTWMTQSLSANSTSVRKRSGVEMPLSHSLSACTTPIRKFSDIRHDLGSAWSSSSKPGRKTSDYEKPLQAESVYPLLWMQSLSSSVSTLQKRSSLDIPSEDSPTASNLDILRHSLSACNTPARKRSEYEQAVLQLREDLNAAPWMEDASTSSSISKRSGLSLSSCSTPARKVSDYDMPKYPGWSPCSTPGRLSKTYSFDSEKDIKWDSTKAGVLSSSVFYKKCKKPLRKRKSNKELRQLKQLNEKALLIELVQDIANDLDITSLCHKILQNVSILTNADRCSLFLVRKFTEGHRILVSKVHNVNAESTVADISANEEIVVAWGSGILGYVAETGETVNLADAYADTRFNQDVDRQTGYQTKSLLCMPIKSEFEKDGNAEVVGVAQVLNKGGGGDAFTEEDEKIFEKYLTFCGIGISNAQLFERLETELKRNEVLLDLARVIFEEQSTLDDIVHKIMQSTQSLIECERCSVLLVHPILKGSFGQVFDLKAPHLVDDEEDYDDNRQVTYPINTGITGYVATTGETLNIPNAYEDPRFDPSVDEDLSFKTRTILCMPVRNSKEEIIGVVQLLNKADGKPFDMNDEHLFEAFAIFCGIAINNTSIYENCVKAWAKQKIALEVLSYHATASASDSLKLMNEALPTSQTFHLREFSFDDATMTDHETVLATLHMFTDLGIHDRFRMDYLTLCNWVLTVKKNYRSVAYHNWRHAFNVMQSMFLMLKENRDFKHNFSDEEKCALLIACLCHDLDHRGLNNTFQVQTSSPLAQLYGTSVMEHHHFDHCIMILNSPGNEILNTLSPQEYNAVIKVIEKSIMATDLALYFKTKNEYFRLVDTKSFQWSENNQKSLLMSMLMTACDLSAICKPWPVQQRVAELVAEEFCQQGDLEQRELHVTPIEMMDRAKHDKFPSMQVGYVDNICMPIYRHLADHFTEFEPMLAYCCENRRRWQELANAHAREEYTASAEDTDSVQRFDTAV